jgi:hypothetical protein
VRAKPGNRTRPPGLRNRDATNALAWRDPAGNRTLIGGLRVRCIAVVLQDRALPRNRTPLTRSEAGRDASSSLARRTLTGIRTQIASSASLCAVRCTIRMVDAGAVARLLSARRPQPGLACFTVASCTWMDSNHRPPVCKTGALTRLSLHVRCRLSRGTGRRGQPLTLYGARLLPFAETTGIEPALPPRQGGVISVSLHLRTTALQPSGRNHLPLLAFRFSSPGG